MVLLMALTRKLEQLHSKATLQPILIEVLEQQKWVQALLTDSLTTLPSNAIPVGRDFAISTKRHIENSENITPTRGFDVSHFHGGFREPQEMQKRALYVSTTQEGCSAQTKPASGI